MGPLLLDKLQTGDNQLRSHGHTGDALHDKLGGNLGLGRANVLGTEEELAVQIGQVDSVHVDQVDIAESQERTVL